MDERTEFTKKVIKLITSIPEGKVATYGLIARLAGKPQGSRGVGWILHSSSNKHELPWQRVLKTSGKISFPEMTEPYFVQKRLLELEGVVVTNGKVNLKEYLWEKKIPKENNRYKSNTLKKTK